MTLVVDEEHGTHHSHQKEFAPFPLSCIGELLLLSVLPLLVTVFFVTIAFLLDADIGGEVQ